MTVIQLTGGRPRKPQSLKELDGTARADRSNRKAPRLAPVKIPAPPKDLSKEEQAAWRELARIVEPLKVATAADLLAFRQMAISLAQIELAREAIADEGQVYEAVTESGVSIRKRPEVEILATFKKQLSVELSRFGLTPADRERVSVLDEGGGEDPLDEFAGGDGG